MPKYIHIYLSIYMCACVFKWMNTKYPLENFPDCTGYDHIFEIIFQLVIFSANAAASLYYQALYYRRSYLSLTDTSPMYTQGRQLLSECVFRDGEEKSNMYLSRGYIRYILIDFILLEIKIIVKGKPSHGSLFYKLIILGRDFLSGTYFQPNEHESSVYVLLP